MKAFLCAVCILLLLVAAMLCYSRCLITHIDRMLGMLDAMSEPHTDHNGIQAEAVALERHWQRIRRLVSLSVNLRTVGQIDHLVTSLRVTAAYGSAQELSLQRILLTEALQELREGTRCDLWGII